MCAHAVGNMAGKSIAKAVLFEESFRLFRAGLSVANAMIAQLVRTGDVVQEARGNQDVYIDVLFALCNIQRHAQHAIDVFAVVRAIAIAHALAHIGIQERVLVAVHAFTSALSRSSENRVYSNHPTKRRGKVPYNHIARSLW